MVSILMILSMAQYSSHASENQRLSCVGVKPDTDGDSTQALVVTYLRGGLDVEVGYIDDRIIDRNRYGLGDEGRPVDAYGYLSLRYRWRWTWGRTHPYIATGIMYVTETNTLTSTRFLFSHGIGVVLGRWELSWRHFSNADLGDQNEGDDLLLLQYRF